MAPKQQKTRSAKSQPSNHKSKPISKAKLPQLNQAKDSVLKEYATYDTSTSLPDYEKEEETRLMEVEFFVEVKGRSLWEEVLGFDAQPILLWFFNDSWILKSSQNLKLFMKEEWIYFWMGGVCCMDMFFEVRFIMYERYIAFLNWWLARVRLCESSMTT